ncbi:hypothetical protein [Geoalkalibacter sp.]|uniref:hypothetical protein n=1 Tax=Geoalkalibacter sp. TaxID=3041440 RepID=UPI00272DE464|nr:hypothetical protein [Geoalkalibacter sp.]
MVLLNEIDILRDVCGRLDQAAIAYMLTGSLAMNYYAIPRMTRDIDMVVEITSRDVSRIEAIFSPDYVLSRDAVEDAVYRQGMFNMIHGESVIKVDFIVRKSDAYRQVEFARRMPVKIADFQTYLVSKEDLILSKLYWSKDSRSEMQLSDVKNLLATGFDGDYLNLWAEKLGLAQMLRECLT